MVFEEREHLALFFAVKQVVVVLHAHEPSPTVEVGGVERLGELPRVHGRRSDVASLARLHDIVQGFHGLFDGRVVVPAMDLVEIDVVGAEAAQAVVDLTQDVLARKALTVRTGAHATAHFGRDDDFITGASSRGVSDR